MLPAPPHLNQLAAGGRYPNGQPSGGRDCMVAVGAMMLAAYSGGELRPSTTEFRARQRDQDPSGDSAGIGLDDVAVAWRSYGQTFDYGSRSWSTVMARLRAGDPVAIVGTYSALGSWRASTYAAGHGLYLQRTAPGGIVVNDPLRSGPVVIPEDQVRRFYSSGGGRAGWGRGVYAGGGRSRGGSWDAGATAGVPVSSLFARFNGGAGWPPATRVTAAMVDEWALYLVELRGPGGASPYFPPLSGGTADELRAHEDATHAALAAALAPYIGRTVGELPASITVTLPAKLTTVDPGAAIAAAGAELGAAIGDAAVGAVVNVAILATVGVLGYLGLKSILTSPAAIGQ